MDSASRTIEKIEILGAVLELSAKQQCSVNQAHLPQKWAKLAVLFSWHLPKQPPGF